MQKFTPSQYLQIDIASNFGLDKSTWNDRLSWFQDNKHHLMELLPQAEVPALYYAGVKAYEAALKGEASGYPISLDATASGLQLLAVLTGDESAAKLCNVINTGKREDAYTVIYEEMLSWTGGNAKITRPDTKDAILTSLYGSQAVPKRVFGEGALLNTFHKVMLNVAPAVWEMNQAFLTMWDPAVSKHHWVMPDNFHVHINVMDQVTETVNFLEKPYDVSYNVNQPTEKGRSLGANTTHSVDGLVVREMTCRCNYDKDQVDKVYLAIMEHGRDEAAEWEGVNQGKDTTMVLTLWQHYKDTGYLSARILDHIHSTNARYVNRAEIIELIESLPKKPFEVLSIHDCFRCLPAYGNDLREQYNRQLYLIAKSDLLSSLVSQILNRKIKVNKMSNTLHKWVLDADYALS